jgi:hypothetical protein
MIPASKQAKTVHALDGSATVTGAALAIAVRKYETWHPSVSAITRRQVQGRCFNYRLQTSQLGKG